jgi:hypothetical protein
VALDDWSSGGSGTPAAMSGCSPGTAARRPSIRYLTGDLCTGEGVVAAVDGTAAIVHCATSSKGDVDATRNLVLTATLHQQDGSLDTP